MLGVAAVILVVLAGIGYYLKWFSVSASSTDKNSPDVHLTLNKDKVKEDVKAVEKDLQHDAKLVSDKVHGLFGEKSVVGPIREITAATKELTVRDDKKQDVTVKVVASTSIKVNDKDGAFSDLKTDDPVTVKYEATKDGNVARTVTVQKK
jgi:hypothetical protein